jgi:hypothetical protein
MGHIYPGNQQDSESLHQNQHSLRPECLEPIPSSPPETRPDTRSRAYVSIPKTSQRACQSETNNQASNKPTHEALVLGMPAECQPSSITRTYPAVCGIGQVQGRYCMRISSAMYDMVRKYWVPRPYACLWSSALQRASSLCLIRCQDNDPELST